MVSSPLGAATATLAFNWGEWFLCSLLAVIHLLLTGIAEP